MLNWNTGTRAYHTSQDACIGSARLRCGALANLISSELTPLDRPRALGVLGTCFYVPCFRCTGSATRLSCLSPLPHRQRHRPHRPASVIRKSSMSGSPHLSFPASKRHIRNVGTGCNRYSPDRDHDHNASPVTAFRAHYLWSTRRWRSQEDALVEEQDTGAHMHGTAPEVPLVVPLTP